MTKRPFELDGDQTTKEKHAPSALVENFEVVFALTCSEVLSTTYVAQAGRQHLRPPRSNIPAGEILVSISKHLGR